MSRRNSRERRDRRYNAAVARQIAARDGGWSWAYAPVEQFLRLGDSVEAHMPEPAGAGEQS